MSDYLWDKTGDVDEEARRLEELLGGLRFQPRPLELPAQLAAAGRPLDSRAARARAPFSRPRLALAASVALALLLGAWLMLADRRPTETTDAPQLAGTHGRPGSAADGKVTSAPSAAPQVGGEGVGGEEVGGEALEKKIESPAPAATRREERAAMPPQPRLPNVARDARRAAPRGVGAAQLTARARRPGRVTPQPPAALPEEIAFTKEEREAAEKVLYALRLTSEKLSYARQQVQDAGRHQSNR